MPITVLRQQKENPLTLSTPPNKSDPNHENTAEWLTRREFVRIEYAADLPKQHRPELTIRYRNYQILDLSEAGIRFAIPRVNLLSDDILSGVVRFVDGSTVEISGVVVRRTKTEIALKLIVGIPYSFIAAEQIRLRNL